jgi:mono/diheme cytochrome c family protein
VRTPLVWLMAASFVFGAATRQDTRTPASPKPGPGASGGGALTPALAPETANLIGTYCVSCHNDRAKTGGLSLQTLSIANLPEHGEVWEKVARKLRSGEMPPSTVRSRPDAKQAEAFAVFVETTLDRAAAARPNPGRAPVHRLNRAEYSNAVRDLLAVDVRPGEWLPVDDSGYGFDNIAAVLSTSPALLDKYMSAAHKVSRLAVGDLTLKPVEEIYDAKRDPNKGPRNEQ